MPKAVRTAKANTGDPVFRALADPTRRRILALIGGGEMRVRDIAGHFDMSRPAISKHLAVLRAAGLVSSRRVGRDNLYAIAPEGLREAAGYVREVEAFWTEGLERLDRRMKDEKR